MVDIEFIRKKHYVQRWSIRRGIFAAPVSTHPAEHFWIYLGIQRLQDHLSQGSTGSQMPPNPQLGLHEVILPLPGSSRPPDRSFAPLADAQATLTRLRKRSFRFSFTLPSAIASMTHNAMVHLSFIFASPRM